ncbi:hypothetical protein TDMWS_14610 [Thermodesulfomicrobium sp. WS]|nr:hypothetical protein TDMWS_14610 [Thermodesulfomicrobium sp. WS]
MTIRRAQARAKAGMAGRIDDMAAARDFFAFSWYNHAGYSLDKRRWESVTNVAAETSS